MIFKGVKWGKSDDTTLVMFGKGDVVIAGGLDKKNCVGSISFSPNTSLPYKVGQVVEEYVGKQTRIWFKM